MSKANLIYFCHFVNVPKYDSLRYSINYVGSQHKYISFYSNKISVSSVNTFLYFIDGYSSFIWDFALSDFFVSRIRRYITGLSQNGVHFIHRHTTICLYETGYADSNAYTTISVNFRLYYIPIVRKRTYIYSSNDYTKNHYSILRICLSECITYTISYILNSKEEKVK